MPGGRHLGATGYVYTAAEAGAGLTIIGRAKFPASPMAQLADLPQVVSTLRNSNGSDSSGSDGSLFLDPADLPYKTFQGVPRIQGRELIAGTTGPGFERL